MFDCCIDTNTHTQADKDDQTGFDIILGKHLNGKNVMKDIIEFIRERLTLYTPYSARMSPENTHKLMRFYMDVLILGVIL